MCWAKDHPFILKLVQTFKDQRRPSFGFGESHGKKLTCIVYIHMGPYVMYTSFPER